MITYYPVSNAIEYLQWKCDYVLNRIYIAWLYATVTT